MNLRIVTSMVLVLVVGVAISLWVGMQPARPPAHRIFVNGQVLSMDADNRIFEAISVRDARVEQLGSSAEIMALQASSTLVTDLQGQTLLPGFIDAHGHFPGSGMSVIAADVNSPPIGTVQTIAELQARLREKLEDKKPGKWLLGFGYDDTLLAEKRHPTREELDAVSTEHPVYIVHVSGHMGVANSLALAAMGIDADSEDPVGGVIVRKPGSREPAGLLEETAHMPVMEHAMDFSMLEGIEMAQAASAEYAALGVTTAQSGGVDAGMARGLIALARFNMIAPRLVLFPFYDLLGPDLLSGAFDPAEVESERLLIGPVKIVGDGSIQGYTGYLSQPYHVPFKGDEEYRGYPQIPRDKLVEIVKQFHAAGFQLAIHGNGDASIDDILYAFELALRETPADDPRLIIIHAQMAREDQLLKMLELGATPSFFSAHTYYWGDRHRDIFMGPERAARMSPTKSAENIGLRYSVHLDTPVVPMNPLQLLWSTVNRESTGGEVIGSEQRVSPMNALRAMTIEAAWQIFQEDNRGSLEPGKYADIVILSGDPLTDVEHVRDLDVVETIVGGVTVFGGELLH
ncbi:MAG: amidohydrolase [Gammaproteobacteria bacterium]|nr:amidohydrolase [Gammaproteobacteria bacterium]